MDRGVGDGGGMNIPHISAELDRLQREINQSAPKSAPAQRLHPLCRIRLHEALKLPAARRHLPRRRRCFSSS